ncbi:MAG TPA: hypothetical protein VLE97_09050 [Gaiellaceae bacterium]|nr:hypothetical protein [Gaiellaceae bacterium]
MKTLGQILGTSNKSVFEDDVDLREGESRDYAEGGHHFRVTATARLGVDTGRRRYRVECLSCSEIVHEATTGAHANIRYHLRDAAERAASGEGKP